MVNGSWSSLITVIFVISMANVEFKGRLTQKSVRGYGQGSVGLHDQLLILPESLLSMSILFSQ